MPREGEIDRIELIAGLRYWLPLCSIARFTWALKLREFMALRMAIVSAFLMFAMASRKLWANGVLWLSGLCILAASAPLAAIAPRGRAGQGGGRGSGQPRPQGRSLP